MDNGKISITLYAGVPYAHIYTHGEIHLQDVIWALNVLKEDFNNPPRIIVENTGEYDISKEAQKRLIRGFETLKEMIIVVHDRARLQEALFAEKSYLLSVKVTIFSTLSDVNTYLAQHG